MNEKTNIVEKWVKNRALVRVCFFDNYIVCNRYFIILVRLFFNSTKFVYWNCTRCYIANSVCMQISI